MSIKTCISFDVGIRHLAYIKWQVKTNNIKNISWQDITIVEWKCIDLLIFNGLEHVQNCKKYGITKLIHFLVVFLKSQSSVFLDPMLDYIVIEKQVSKSPRNQMMMVALYMFFYLEQRQGINITIVPALEKFKLVHFLKDSICTFVPRLDSILKQSSNKLVLCYPDTCKTASQKKTWRKNQSIDICKLVMNTYSQFQPWKEQFLFKKTKKETKKRKQISTITTPLPSSSQHPLTNTKKIKLDDLSDCWLQAMTFTFFHSGFHKPKPTSTTPTTIIKNKIKKKQK